MIGLIERRCRAIVRRIVEVPFWRGELPNELVKSVPIFVVAAPTALCRKIVLIPPSQFSLWRQWQLLSLQVRYDVATDGDESFTAFRPNSRYDVCCSRSPIITRKDRLFNLERIE